jgi:hypothetical protein
MTRIATREHMMARGRWWRTRRAERGAGCGTWRTRAQTRGTWHAWPWHWCGSLAGFSSTRRRARSGQRRGFLSLAVETNLAGLLCRSPNSLGATAQPSRRGYTSLVASRPTSRLCLWCLATRRLCAAQAAGAPMEPEKPTGRRSARQSASTPRTRLLFGWCSLPELATFVMPMADRSGVGSPARKPAPFTDPEPGPLPNLPIRAPTTCHRYRPDDARRRLQAGKAFLFFAVPSWPFGR